MTNTELIQKIRNEIEKQIKDPQEHCYGISSVNKLKELLSFLDTLEKECQWSAEDETKIAYICDVMSGKELVSDISPSYRSEIIEFAKSLQPTKVKSEKPNQDELEDEMDRFFETMPVLEHENIFEDTFKNIARHFAEWGEEHLADVRKMIKSEKKEGRTDCSPQGEVPNDSLATQSYENIPKDLEEAADEMALRAFPEKKSYSTVIDRVVDYNAVDRKNYRDGIIAGAKWQADHTPLPEDAVLFSKGVEEGKRLMMEEAVECELYYDGDFLAIDLNMAELGYSERDKVRIIIVKED